MKRNLEELKLIALFMGAKERPHTGNRNPNNGLWFDGDETEGPVRCFTYDLEDLKYDTEYAWIMPVIGRVYGK